MPSQTRTQVLQYTLLSRDALNAEDMDLYELVHLSGVVMDPNVYKILLDLLRMNVTPTAIEKMLKSMLSSHHKRADDTKLAQEHMAPPAPRPHSSSSSSVTSQSATSHSLSRGRQKHSSRDRTHRKKLKD